MSQAWACPAAVSRIRFALWVERRLRVTGRIIQFGTSRFLQAHVDLFVHEAREAGQAVGPIAVVQASGSAEPRRARCRLRPSGGLSLIIRGLENGTRIERRIDVRSVDRGLSAARDWEAVSELFATEADLIVSNTRTLATRWRQPIAIPRCWPAACRSPSPASSQPSCTAAGGRAVVRSRCCRANSSTANGRVLAQTVRALATDAQAPAAFLAWLERDVIFADTLVDRNRLAGAGSRRRGGRALRALGPSNAGRALSRPSIIPAW